jgi:hypothetical protein
LFTKMRVNEDRISTRMRYGVLAVREFGVTHLSRVKEGARRAAVAGSQGGRVTGVRVSNDARVDGH